MMLVSLGRRGAPDDVVALLLACHDRIRAFLGIAARLADAPPGTVDIAASAGSVRRYFAEAFPLHVADENETIAPALATEPTARDAIAAMHRDHDDHAPAISALVRLCGALERDPGALPAVARELTMLLADLTPALEAHLALEERVIFPALRRLPAREQDAIVRALRARRSPSEPDRG